MEQQTQTIREIAIAWFNDKDTYNKSELSHKYFKDTISYNFTSLTGREIQSIYEAEHQQNSVAPKNYVGTKFEFLNSFYSISGITSEGRYIIEWDTSIMSLLTEKEVKSKIADGTWVIVPDNSVLDNVDYTSDDGSNPTPVVNKFIDYTPPTVRKDSITFYGAGKFHESSLHWNKQQAMMAYIDLHKFIMNDDSSEVLPVHKSIKVDDETLESKIRNILTPIKNFITLSRNLLQDPIFDDERELIQDCGLSADQHIYMLINEIHNYENKNK